LRFQASPVAAPVDAVISSASKRRAPICVTFIASSISVCAALKYISSCSGERLSTSAMLS
jgi:hypothetical protein